MAELLIDRPQAEDRPHWEGLFRGYLAFYETRLEDEVIDHTWKRLLDPDGGINGFLARDAAKRPIGMVHYLFHPSCWTLGPYCYLQDLFVDPDRRGGGTGRALIQAVYTAADAHGASQVYWLTQEFNHGARHLYDQVATLTPFIKYRR